MDNIASILPELRGFFLNELAELINRYNKAVVDRKESIKRAVDLINRLTDSQKELCLNNVQEIVKALDDYKEEIVELHTWCRLNISSQITLEQAKDYSEQLVNDGFFRIEEYIIYLQNAPIRTIKENLLQDFLEDEYYVDKLFDKDALIEMWLDGTTKEEAMKDMIISLEVEEIIQDETIEAYQSKELGTIMYACIE